MNYIFVKHFFFSFEKKKKKKELFDEQSQTPLYLFLQCKKKIRDQNQGENYGATVVSCHRCTQLLDLSGSIHPSESNGGMVPPLHRSRTLELKTFLILCVPFSILQPWWWMKSHFSTDSLARKTTYFTWTNNHVL